MKHQAVTFVYPGDLDTRTGGYRYDKRIIEEIGQQDGKLSHWRVTLVSLEGDYPFPTPLQLDAAAQRFESIEDNTLTVVDGLAYSVMPEIIARHATRLNIIALIHHPLALETGLSAGESEQLKDLETQALHYAKRIVTTSHLTASSLSQYNVPSHKVSAVLPGTDSANIANSTGCNVVQLLCVATLTPRKAHHVLLDALSKIKPLPWYLHCVGSKDRHADTYQTLLEQCEHHALSHRVSFTGEVDDKQLDRLYLEADLFVLASLHEGYGMVLSEAIAHGLPIICSDAGAMSQTVPEGAGVLVPPGDSEALAIALARFLDDAKHRAQLREAALDARKQLRSWQTAANEFSGVLTQTMLSP